MADTSAEEWARSAARLSYVDGEAFNAWLNSVKAEAWQEGYWDGRRSTGEGDDGPRYVNPYSEKEAGR